MLGINNRFGDGFSVGCGESVLLDLDGGPREKSMNSRGCIACTDIDNRHWIYA